MTTLPHCWTKELANALLNPNNSLAKFLSLTVESGFRAGLGNERNRKEAKIKVYKYLKHATIRLDLTPK